MSGNQQALLMANDGGFTPPVCIPDSYFSCVSTGTAPRTVLAVHADSSPLADTSCFRTKTVSLTGAAEVQATVVKFGAGAVAIPNTGASSTNGIEVVDDTDFDFGTSNLTISFWAYRTANTFAGYLFDLGTTTVRSTAIVGTDGLLDLVLRSSGGTNTVNNLVSFPLAQWNFVVLQRRGPNWELYLNGVLVYAARVGLATPATDTVNSSGNWYFGRAASASAQALNGYIDEIRIWRGAAIYEAPYPVPISAYPASGADPFFANVVALLPGDGANGSSTITNSASGGAAVTSIGVVNSTAQTKFGTAYLEFAGTGYATVPNTNFLFGANDFTVESWVYLTSFAKNGFIFSQAENSVSNFAYFYVGTLTNGAVAAYVQPATAGAGSATLIQSAPGMISLNSWTHVAFSRRGTLAFLFVNGVPVGSTTTWQTFPDAKVLFTGFGGIPNGFTNPTQGRIEGYLDDVRITNGVARYTSAFIPPTMPFCDAASAYVTSGSERLAGQSVTTGQGSVRVLDTYAALSGVRANAQAGTVIAQIVDRSAALSGASATAAQGVVGVFTPDRASALSGTSSTVLSGGLAVAPYPALVSSTTSLPASFFNPAATILVSTNGTASFSRDGVSTEQTVWLANNAFYSASAVSGEYRVVSVVLLSGTLVSPPALPHVLVSDFSVVTTSAADVQINIAPTPTNPRYGEPGYYASVRVIVPPAETT